jgi:ribosomal protein S18 acetylase RimI-like enzyme
VIREWRLADGDRLRRLWHDLGMLSPWDDDASLEVLARRNPGLLLVAAAGDEVVGSALGAWDGRRGWIYHVAIAPGHRRRGIGRQLVARIEAGLRAVGCPKVNVIVLDDNAEGVAFWRDLGYTRLPARQFSRRLAEERLRAT